MLCLVRMEKQNTNSRKFNNVFSFFFFSNECQWASFYLILQTFTYKLLHNASALLLFSICC